MSEQTEQKQFSIGKIPVAEHNEIMVPLQEIVLELKKHGYPAVKRKVLAASSFKLTTQFLKRWFNTVLSLKEAKAVAEKEVFRKMLMNYLLSEAAKKYWFDLAKKLADELTEECYPNGL